ncbi:MAG: hypothetical protein ACKPEO_04095 [Sphaerospermopsis kisseleviana]|jgi:hypothetical protein|uniref:Uncharacterized protein n=2 Tax=Sphaerospermopsis TaxID=752201 RepID=A0ABR9V7S4_9CYAN|nr:MULTISPECIES: hypothetical protein [Sphaerospermopsis]MBD2146293.1 hypothetical protein [Sphaerospermopsis sp. FACHB-1194]MBE9234538.1 hypothetical protein [Sphaerospermopsis aphanizomenoides LEGE 00250]MDB9442505.1 hypothetical protein [Sphaerospermopsis kisseleviana CS-549]BAZ83187.1 hypothetical protein NIES73_44740 [Sphaerospermopsis kisseleviana NIES-73]
MNVSISDQIIEQLKIMSQDLQYQVLEFARSLTTRVGILHCRQGKTW